MVVGGDLNVYPRPDDPFAPIGQAGYSDQLGALYDPNLGLKNLWEDVLSQAPESAYSYVYVGMAQTLDQMFMNHALLTNLHQVRLHTSTATLPRTIQAMWRAARAITTPMVATIYWACQEPTADARRAIPREPGRQC